MSIIFIIIGVILFESIQDISQEQTVRKYDYRVHIATKFPIIFMFVLLYNILSIFTGKNISEIVKISLEYDNLFILFLVVLIGIITTIIFNRLLKNTSIYILTIFTKITIYFVLAIELIRSELILDYKLFFGIWAFTFGLIIMIVLNKNIDKKVEVSNWIGIIILAILITISPYLQQYLLRKDAISPEMLVMAESLGLSMYGLLILRPKVDSISRVVRDYLPQSLFCAIASILFKILAEKSVFLHVTTNVVVVACVTFTIGDSFKTKIKKVQYLGVFFSTFGIFLN